jgi:hypothetical protein
VPFKVSFVVQDEEQVQNFVNDAIATDGLIAYCDTDGDDIELQTYEITYEEV